MSRHELRDKRLSTLRERDFNNGAFLLSILKATRIRCGWEDDLVLRSATVYQSVKRHNAKINRYIRLRQRLNRYNSVFENIDSETACLMGCPCAVVVLIERGVCIVKRQLINKYNRLQVPHQRIIVPLK
ncbi:hypothetical protein TNCV_328081 [Trichonephila clavipes]|nr:hypothetical protein TNCV_328081 [Trichonephila clavipes]